MWEGESFYLHSIMVYRLFLIENLGRLCMNH